MQLQAERCACAARELEPGQRRRKIDIFRQTKDLETASEHFGMEQRLQFAL